jgi:predicted secreted Zn-dependent protease
MSRFLLFAALAAVVLSSVSCAALAQAKPPAFVVSEPIAIRDETSQDGIVRLKLGVWRRTYEVPGDDVQEIARNLNALRVNAGHGDFSAQTKWDLRWSMRYKEEAGACRLIAVTLEYYAVVTLPALVNEAALLPADLDRWYGFADALEAHEMAHIEHEIAAAEALRQSLLTLEPQPDCQTMAALVTSHGEGAKEAIRRADEAFDAETKHGALEGATFP